MTAPAAPEKKPAMRQSFTCWCCGGRGTVEASRQVTPTYMEAYYRCNNINCGHSWVAAISALRTLSPSSYPAPPGVVVPISSHVQRAALQRQLEQAPTADGGEVFAGIHSAPIPAQLDLLDHSLNMPVEPKTAPAAQPQQWHSVVMPKPTGIGKTAKKQVARQQRNLPKRC